MHLNYSLHSRFQNGLKQALDSAKVGDCENFIKGQ